MICYMNISYLDTCKTFSRELKVFKLWPKLYTEFYSVPFTNIIRKNYFRNRQVGNLQPLKKYQAKNYENINNAQYIYLIHFYKLLHI